MSQALLDATRKGLELFLQVLEEDPKVVDNPHSFQLAIAAFYRVYGFTQHEMADAFNMARPTINRWVNCHNLPSKPTRISIVLYMKAKIRERIDEILETSPTPPPQEPFEGG